MLPFGGHDYLISTNMVIRVVREHAGTSKQSVFIYPINTCAAKQNIFRDNLDTCLDVSDIHSSHEAFITRVNKPTPTPKARGRQDMAESPPKVR